MVPAAQGKALRAGAMAKIEEFVPVPIEAAKADPPDIRIEIRAGENLIAVHWPMSAAGACGAWLRALLQ